MLSQAESLALQPPAIRQAVLDQTSEAEAAELLYDWRFNGRPEQLLPGTEGAALGNTGWLFWLILAGRGFGKTRTGAETVREWAENSNERILMIAPTAADVRDTMVEGISGLLQCYPPHQQGGMWEPSKRRIWFPSGAIGITRSADEPERLRGPQFTKFWADELCLSAGTGVLCAEGQMPIERVRAGMLVQTRVGLRRVIRSWRTTESATVYRLKCSDGSELIGTSGHPVYSNGTFRPLNELQPGDTLLTWREWWNGAVKSGGSTAVATGRHEMENYCTGRSGKPRTARFPLASTSITGTRTSLTSSSGTLKLSRRANITDATRRADGMQRQSLDPSAHEISSPTRNHTELSALNAELTSRASVSVRASARELVTVVSIEELAEREPVYNLEVDGAHEYFANGILTHNCAWRFLQEAWDQIMFGFRVKGRILQGVITTTPKPSKLLTELVGDPSTVITRGSSYDNRRNLADAFINRVLKPYEGTRLGRQEINAEILTDTPGALWTSAMIDGARIKLKDILWDRVVRIVCAVDPAVTAEDGSDETGIVVAALLISQHVLVLDDLSLRGSPLEWATAATGVLKHPIWPVERIVAEVNNGGDLVEANIRTVEKNAPFSKVWASHGKRTRAEPIAAAYEQGRVHHVGVFSMLEAQMTTFVPGKGASPDRMDALVYAITELLFPQPVEQRFSIGEIQQISPV